MEYIRSAVGVHLDRKWHRLFLPTTRASRGRVSIAHCTSLSNSVALILGGRKSVKMQFVNGRGGYTDDSGEDLPWPMPHHVWRWPGIMGKNPHTEKTQPLLGKASPAGRTTGATDVSTPVGSGPLLSARSPA